MQQKLDKSSDYYFTGSGNFADRRLAKAKTSATHVINRIYSNLYPTPEQIDTVETQLIYGERVSVIRHKDSFCQVINHTDGYTGWIVSDHISPIKHTNPKTMIDVKVCIPLSHLYKQPDLKSAHPIPVTFGAILHLKSAHIQNGFYQTSDGYFIYAKHIQKMGQTTISPLDYAYQFLNTPYLWAGRTGRGIDCSALVQLCFGACEIFLHRDSDLQWQHGGTVIATSWHDPQCRPKAGDLAFFPGHVGIMVNETDILHANATHMKVTINPLTDVIKWVENEGKKTAFLGFKRFHKIK